MKLASLFQWYFMKSLTLNLNEILQWFSHVFIFEIAIYQFQGCCFNYRSCKDIYALHPLFYLENEEFFYHVVYLTLIIWLSGEMIGLRKLRMTIFVEENNA